MIDRHDAVRILLVDDDPGDVELTMEVLKESKLKLTIDTVSDGEQALKYLRGEGRYAGKPRPDLLLLDLNMPKVDGREVLRQVKGDPDLKTIPVVVLTTSDADQDVLHTYDLGANCFVTKPVGLDQFAKVVKSIEDFWFMIVKLPPAV